ncbi:dienelactone hydrolase family protein [Pseudomonas gingeri]|uniref:dienelactone hydrolase family protein n=1 Tax=Pseudomonas gingeri TaxID=117681 RepID=UPI0015A1E434|nr:dienelactone hydrolase family protein [Pseudomonas gingeri]NVZ60719.1 dienelactone hydrolase family protein [Pseudomonas gingeri]NVZ75394.1 dienelactone hydrolase family protein [Pseudomonas gingeri]
MKTRNLDEYDPLEDFLARKITLNGTTKMVHVSGSGPAVIVIPEVPGISPHVARFARWVREAGFTVYMPSLYGRDGEPVDLETGQAIFKRVCVSAEFRAFGAGGSSPVTKWLRALANLAHSECGGPGVGAIGMCFSGNFALSMMLEPSMLAPVLAQPALPLDDDAGLEIDPDELKTIKVRMIEEDLTVMAYRFEGDRFCKAQRFAAYEEALGDRFVGRVLPDSSANKDMPEFFEKVVQTPHNVVTVHLIDEEGEPTRQARDEILAFFVRRLAA